MHDMMYILSMTPKKFGGSSMRSGSSSPRIAIPRSVLASGPKLPPWLKQAWNIVEI